MSTAFKYYKRRFKNALEPLLVMLVAKKPELTPRRWNALVLKTVISILNNPCEYLGTELPDYHLVCDIMHEIVQQFFHAKGDKSVNGFPPVSEKISEMKLQAQLLKDQPLLRD
jgi:hypothetical protein